MIGNTYPNSADTAGGSTPDITVNVAREFTAHVSKNGTYAVKEAKFAKMEMMESGTVLTKHTKTRKAQPMVRLRGPPQTTCSSSSRQCP